METFSVLCSYHVDSGIARAFLGGRAAHPEDQNEEENEENLRKKIQENGKCS